MEETKRCYTCKKQKAKSEFYKNSAMVDGCMSSCKSCSIIYNREWRKKIDSDPFLKEKQRQRQKVKNRKRHLRQ